jgi:LPS-assembly protein
LTDLTDARKAADDLIHSSDFLTFKIRILIPLLLFRIFLLSDPAYAQVPVGDAFFAGKDPIILSADKISLDAGSGVYSAKGSVEVKQGEVFIKAENITINLKRKTIDASGGCILGNQQGELSAPSLHLNLEKETGVIVNGRLVVYGKDNNFYFKGESIEKVAENRFIIREGWYSTCDCGEDEADWFIQAKEIDITIDGYAVVRHGKVYAKGVPVAYLPYGVIPAKITRQSGFLPPMMGWATDDGYHFGIPFFWAIDHHVDATIYSDWYEKRGVKEGFEYRYSLSEDTKGQFDLDYIDDGLYDERRWATSFEHRQKIMPRTYIRSKINAISDNDYVNDFPGDITARYDRFLRSNVILNKLWQNYDANINFEHYDDLDNADNSFTWQKLPEVNLNVLDRPIADFPLSWRIDAAGVNFYRRHISATEKIIDSLEGHDHPYTHMTSGRRFDIAPLVAAPMNFNRWAFWTPSFQWQQTFYELPDRADNEKSETRQLYDARSLLFTRTERIFSYNGETLKGLKHTVEPGLNYQYIPFANQDELPYFDGEDRINRRNEITGYLANRLWARIAPLRARRPMTSKLIDFSISQTYDVHEAQRELLPGEDRRPFRPLHAAWESTVRMQMWLNSIVLRSSVDYDTYIDHVRSYNVLGSLASRNDDSVTVEYRYGINDQDFREIDYISGQARYTLMSLLTLSYMGRYSFLDDYFIERKYGIELHSTQNCWHLLFEIEDREIPEEETIYRVSLDLTGLIIGRTSF